MKTRNTILKGIKLGVFFIYIGVLLYFLLFAENLGRTTMTSDYKYNLTPFKEIKRFIIHYNQLGAYVVITNLLGNVVAFIPYGVLLPALTNNRLKFFAIMLYTFIFTLLIESIQLITKVGSFDVDDIILNTLGGIVGYLVYFAWESAKERKKCKA